MQLGEETFYADISVPGDGDAEDPRMWYVRLRIRDDRLAKLWVWNLADHDVIVWSEPEERWKRLLAVPALRAAVRSATTSAYARTKPVSDAPPVHSSGVPPVPSAPPPPSHRRELDVADLDLNEPPTRLHHALHNESLGDDDDPPTRVHRFVSDRPRSEPPQSVDPLLRALTTSIPPAVHSAPAPEIPRAPRTPTFIELFPHQRPIATRAQVPPLAPSRPPPPSQSAPPRPRLVQSMPQAISQSSVVAPRLIQSMPRAISQFSIKNISWAMVPVACAGVLAIFLDRNASVIERAALVAQRSAAPVSAAGVGDADPSGEKLATLMVGVGPVCEGKPQAQPSVLSPEQLAAVPNTASVSSRNNWRTAKVTAAGVATPRKISNKGLANAAGATGSGSVDGNEFDREGAKTALRFAIARVRNCSNSGLSGSALITFAPSGTVQSVQLSQLVGDDVDPSCVSRALSACRVPPFAGSAVTVRKSF
jgi:hypothetical protein